MLGSVYALIALGYTLVYGVLRLINFAHADIFMLATFGSFIAIGILGIGSGTQYQTGLALVATLTFCMIVSMAIGAGERGRPRTPRLPTAAPAQRATTGLPHLGDRRELRHLRGRRRVGPEAS